MKPFISVWTLPLLAGLLLCACHADRAAQRQIHYYVLEYETPEIRPVPRLPLVLRVDRFNTAVLYSSTNIIYSDGAYKRNAYTYHKWRSNPGEMLGYLLARDIHQSALYKAVFTPDTPFAHSHVVEGLVEEFYEKDGPDDWTAVLTLRITLLMPDEPDVSKKILMQKRYHATENCREKSPRSLAEAMSRAMQKLSKQIMEDTYACLSATDQF